MNIWYVSSWATWDKEFKDVPIRDLTQSCDAIFQRKRSDCPVKHSIWSPPLHGILKLNFEGSFSREERKGRYSRVGHQGYL